MSNTALTVAGGTVTLTGVNTYSGTTTVQGGTLELSGGNAIANTGAVVLANAALLSLVNSETIGSLQGTGAVQLGSRTLAVGSDNSSTTYAGVLSGSNGAITKQGTGTFTISGANTFTGTTTISAGTLQLGAAGALPTTAFLDVASGATFSLNNFNQQATVQGAGNIVLGSGTLTTSFFGSVVHSGTISGSGGIVKGNGGTLTLNGLSNYTGPTSVNAGTLELNGSSTSTIGVASGARLGGLGTTTGGVNIQSGGTVAPGNSPGILNTGNFSLLVGSTLEIEIGGTTPGNTANNHDQVNVTGTVNLAGSLTALKYNDFIPAAGNTFTIINNDGSDPVVGTFAGLNEGATFTSDNVTYTVSYVGGNGNDVVLTALYATFVVTTTSDSGAGSLRQSILDANATSGINVISFNIPGTGVHTIAPASALPTVTGTVTIDGTTETDFAGVPLIELRGDSAGAGINGLTVTASNSIVRGLVINRFNGSGILISGAIALGNEIIGNYIGTNTAGSTALANGSYGIFVTSGANANTIGGSSVAARNIISGNNVHGVYIVNAGTANNTVQGNYIGTDASGNFDLGNSQRGIYVEGGGSNTIRNNVVSGNDSQGILLGFGNNDILKGNIIGLNAAGTAALGNSGGGLYITSSNNTIGGTSATDRNIISGNTGYGVKIEFASRSGNVIQGNYIGTDISGTIDLGNTSHGVFFAGSAHDNTIGGTAAGAGNVISGNNSNGIYIENSNNTAVAGNFIGTKASGTEALGNSGDGVQIFNSTGTSVGGTTAGARNIISGNVHGITVTGGSTAGTLIQGNFIGTDVNGNADLGNSVSGVWVTFAANTSIGGASAGAGNVISGNNAQGIHVQGGATTTIQGNYIGTNAAGTSALGNSAAGIRVESANNTIGGTAVGARNVISGNSGSNGYGVIVTGTGSTGNFIQGNYIGTNAAGTAALGNGTGVQISSGASTNTVGGSAADAGNVISGNSIAGVSIQSPTTTSTIRGNVIGLDVSGTSAIGNGQGVYVNGANHVIDNNTIAGNLQQGIQLSSVATATVITRNTIGTDAGRTRSLPNTVGISFFVGASNNTIGGAASDQGNFIANSRQSGLSLPGATSANNTFQNNLYFANIGLAIDAGVPGVTANDNGDTDSVLNFPILTKAYLSGSDLVVEGIVGAGRPVELYLASATGNGFGSGRRLLGTVLEGSAADGLSGTESYGPSVRGVIVGSSSGNQFKMTLPLPADIQFGSLLTALAVGSTSEFSSTITVGDVTSNLAPVITLPGATTINAGESLTLR